MWLVFKERGGFDMPPNCCWNRALGVGNVELVAVGNGGGGGDMEMASW